MEHHFNIEIAKKFGVDGAIIIHNIYFWIKKNEANKKHFHDNKYWTYNSTSAFSELFPYWSKRQIERILSKLLKEGAILKGNYNEMPYDRTSWYTITETVKCIYANGEMDIRKRGNAYTQTVEPIPDSKTQIVKPNSKTDVFTEKEKNPFFESVEAWINENAPRLNKMDNPLTESECLKIKNDYSPEQMKSMFLKMHNYKPLLKKNKSTYLTFKNWMERETSNKPQKSKMKSI